MTLTHQLRERTRSLHERLDATPFALALASGGFELQSYVSYLRSLAVIHAALERSLDAETFPDSAPLWHPSMGRLPLLLEDLEHFRGATPTDCEDALDAALGLAAQIRRQAARKKSRAWLGYFYVLEGSKGGAATIKRHVARTLGLQAEGGLRYLVGSQRAGSRTWAQTCNALDDVALAEADREAVVAAACETYATMIRVFEALHPLRRESVRTLASSFNPEAGLHPVTDDPREIEAALAAGRSTWEAFPYLERRYGDRGRRFTTSDSVWLVTLTRTPREAALQQVLWLGHVLAARGMPRIILATHLSRLSQELVRAVPENEALYRVLAEAGEMLCGKRRRCLDDAAMAQLAAEFDAHAGVEHAGLSVGILIAAAVCDEHDAVPAAIASLTAWLCDPTRFGSAFIASVHATIVEARATIS